MARGESEGSRTGLVGPLGGPARDPARHRQRLPMGPGAYRHELPRDQGPFCFGKALDTMKTSIETGHFRVKSRVFTCFSYISYVFSSLTW